MYRYLPAVAPLVAFVLSSGALGGAAADRCAAEAPPIVEITEALAAATTPTAPAALRHGRGRLLHDRGHEVQARADYDAALALDPDLAVAYLDRGRLFADQARYPAALADFDRAIELQPAFLAARLQRGDARYEIGDHIGAVADFSAAIEIDAKSSAAYLGRANALRDDGRADQALADYAAAIRLAPEDALAWFQRAIAQHRLDRFEAERADWTTAIRLDPDIFWLYGAVYRHRHLYEELRSDHRVARQRAPDGAKALFNRGEAYRYRRQYCRAIADFTRAIDLRSGYDDAHLARGIARHAIGAHADATRDLTQALERNPNDVEALFYRARAFRAQSMPERARVDLESAKRLAPFNPVIRAAAEP